MHAAFYKYGGFDPFINAGSESVHAIVKSSLFLTRFCSAEASCVLLFRALAWQQCSKLKMFEWSVNDTKQWSYRKNIASFWRLISLSLEYPKIVANLSSSSPKFCADIFITSWWAVLPLDVGFKVDDMSGCHRTVCHIDNIKFNSLWTLQELSQLSWMFVLASMSVRIIHPWTEHVLPVSSQSVGSAVCVAQFSDKYYFAQTT